MADDGYIICCAVEEAQKLNKRIMKLYLYIYLYRNE